MENTIQLELLELVKNLQKFQQYLPEDCSIEIEARRNTYATIALHRCKDHDEALAVKRMFGMKDASKSVYDPQSPWHCLQGEITKGVECKIFVSGLPPMCQVVEYEEEIPKTDIVTLAETVKVKRTRICCGEQVGAQ